MSYYNQSCDLLVWHEYLLYSEVPPTKGHDICSRGKDNGYVMVRVEGVKVVGMVKVELGMVRVGGVKVELGMVRVEGVKVES